MHVHDLYKMITYLCFLRTFFLAFNSHWQVLWVYEQYTESSLKNCRHIVLIRGKKCLSYCIFNNIYKFLSNLKFLLEVIIHLVIFFFYVISFHDLNKWEFEECLTVSIFQIWKKYFHWLWINKLFYFDKKIETRNLKFIFLLSTSMYFRYVQLVKNRLV